jgi:hypothetical protein
LSRNGRCDASFELRPLAGISANIAVPTSADSGLSGVNLRFHPSGQFEAAFMEPSAAGGVGPARGAGRIWKLRTLQVSPALKTRQASWPLKTAVRDFATILPSASMAGVNSRRIAACAARPASAIEFETNLTDQTETCARFVQEYP